MKKSYKILEIEHECKNLNKLKRKATFTAIWSTFILGFISISLIAIDCFEPLNSIDEQIKELLSMLLVIGGAGDVYFLINSISRKVGLEMLIRMLNFEKNLEKDVMTYHNNLKTLNNIDDGNSRTRQK